MDYLVITTAWKDDEIATQLLPCGLEKVNF